MDVFENRSASKVEVVVVGKIILQTIYCTVDERRDNLDQSSSLQREVDAGCFPDHCRVHPTRRPTTMLQGSLSPGFPPGATVDLYYC